MCEDKVTPWRKPVWKNTEAAVLFHLLAHHGSCSHPLHQHPARAEFLPSEPNCFEKDVVGKRSLSTLLSMCVYVYNIFHYFSKCSFS